MAEISPEVVATKPAPPAGDAPRVVMVRPKDRLLAVVRCLAQLATNISKKTHAEQLINEAREDLEVFGYDWVSSTSPTLADFEHLYVCQHRLSPEELAERHRKGERVYNATPVRNGPFDWPLGPKICGAETRRYDFEHPTDNQKLYCDQHCPKPEDLPAPTPASLKPVTDDEIPF